MIRVTGCISFLLAVLIGTCGCSSLFPEKRIREPIHASYSVSDAEFANSIGQLLSAPLGDGNNVIELLNGDQIFPAMLEAIRNAQKTITFEMYIWSSGEVSKQFVEALSERARAGVRVHIIVDTFGSGKLPRSDREALREAGAELVTYNPPQPHRVFRFNHRTHRKNMVVDGRIGFTGGVCIHDAWSGNAEPDHWRDTHFRVEGPVVGQMQGVFMDNWIQMRSEVLHGRDYFPELQPAGNMKAQFFKSGPSDAAENARLAYQLSIAAAQKTIRLAHAYFVPDALLFRTLLAARGRGVKIEVIVPSKIDNFAVKKAGRARWRGLLEAGVEFYEYQPTLYHLKVMIVDDIWVTAGSVNFDDRSFKINDEANINVLDAGFAATMTKSFEADKRQSRLLTAEAFRSRNVFSKFFDHFFGLFRSQL
ncbi:MAG TPA: phospholipase D-like domain-containing protein [Verrucomicrobiae bacterium]|nr:phospholipase D-like domain-containing protein [Verrucomicrobiae bacterium]